jgi:hypothetical protein
LQVVPAAIAQVRVQVKYRNPNLPCARELTKIGDTVVRLAIQIND